MAAAKRYGRADRGEVEGSREVAGSGATIPGVCKKLRVSEQTFYRWRTKYSAMKEDEAVG
jgi:putative transposase